MAPARQSTDLRRAVRGLTRGEVHDTVAASRPARALDPLSWLLRRSADLSLNQESARIFTLAFSFVRSEGVPGDFCEFGVFTGRTFVDAWRIGKEILPPSRPCRYLAFDSFEGLPPVEGVDDTGRWEEGWFSFGQEAFEARLRRARVPVADVHIVPGFYDRSLAEPERIPLEQVAIAMIDCDLYSSTVPVLDYLAPRLSQGAILLFDDWYLFKGDPERGQQRASAEWLARNPGFDLVPWRQFDWGGQAFIFRRPEDESS